MPKNTRTVKGARTVKPTLKGSKFFKGGTIKKAPAKFKGGTIRRTVKGSKVVPTRRKPSTGIGVGY